MLKKFPVCPQALPLEALSSWIIRIARYYKIDVDTLFEVGFLEKKPNTWWEIDVNPSNNLLFKISECTNVPIKNLKQMTLNLFTPLICDSIDRLSEFEFNEIITQYVILNSVPPYQKSKDTKKSIVPWLSYGPWKHSRLINRFCPVCVENDDLDLPYLLIWRTTLVSSCSRHDCLLIEERNQQWDKLSWKENIKTTKRIHNWLDNITIGAIESGTAKLGNEKINVLIWIRFLRSLFHELTTASRDLYDRENIKNIWACAGVKKPKPKAFELLDANERGRVTRCAAFLLQDFPKKIIPYIKIKYKKDSMKVPYFLAKHMKFKENYYDLIRKDKDEAIKIIAYEMGGEEFFPAAALMVCFMDLKMNKEPEEINYRNIKGAEVSNIDSEDKKFIHKCRKINTMIDKKEATF